MFLETWETSCSALRVTACNVSHLSNIDSTVISIAQLDHPKPDIPACARRRVRIWAQDCELHLRRRNRMCWAQFQCSSISAGKLGAGRTFLMSSMRTGIREYGSQAAMRGDHDRVLIDDGIGVTLGRCGTNLHWMEPKT